MKSVVAAMSIAAQQLAQCGFDLEASASHGVKALVISEMSAADVERTQAEAEAAYHGGFGFVADGADLPSDDEPV